MKNERFIYDSAWKEILENYFQSFIQFFFPEIYEEIDWGRGHEFLDKEFQKIVRDAKIEKRFVDKLVKVYRNSGEETWVLIHIEMQTQIDQTLTERMYVYNSQIYLKYKKQIMSIAVLGDKNPHWRPERFEYTLWGSHVSLQFQTIKLLDYRRNLDDLQTSLNPFAFFVIAHFITLETHQNWNKRLEWKTTITKKMIELGMPEAKAAALFRFIDFLMYLPEELEKKFTQEIHRYQEEKKMPFIAPFEKLAIKQGLEQGWQEGMQQGMQEGMQQGLEQGQEQGSLDEAREAIIDILNWRFPEISPSMKEPIRKIDDLSRLRNIRKHAIIAQSHEEFTQLFEADSQE